MENLPALGIDVAKAKFDVELHVNHKTFRQSFPNHADGFAQLGHWLQQHQVARVHACLEATGSYWEALAQALHQAGHRVSVVNPARIKGFAQSELVRTKTDQTDAALIARFCESQNPEAWTPPPPEIRELRDLVRRLDDLNQMLNQEENRLASGTLSEVVRSSLETMIAMLKEQIKQVKRQIRDHLQQHPGLRQQAELISSIPGLGELTAANLLAEFGDLLSYGGGRQLVAYAGLSPQERTSGSSVRGKPRLCKIGSARLRKTLYMPAVVGLRYNPAVQALAERLRARGKHTRCILGAIMRKLLHWVYGVLKSGRPFDAEFAIQQMKGA
jgi:transposase